MASYVIKNIQPSIVIETGGRPVNGFLVRVLLSEFDEVRDLELESDEPEVIHEAAMNAIGKRKRLEELAGDS